MTTYNSTYYFLGTLYPQDLCNRYDPKEIQIENGWVLDVFHHGISLWNPKVPDDFDHTGVYARDAVSLIVIIFNFLTRSRLKVKFDNWVEAKNVSSSNNMIGWFINKQSNKKSLNRRNKLNVAWRKAGKYFPKINQSFFHKIALKDYQNLMDAGITDDAFFYAFRIVEDIRRAITQHMPPGLDEKKYWQEMHAKLGINENQIKPLTEVSENIRHGNFTDPVVVAAKRNRDQILNIAIEVMKKEFKRNFRGLF